MIHKKDRLGEDFSVDDTAVELDDTVVEGDDSVVEVDDTVVRIFYFIVIDLKVIDVYDM